MYIQLQGGRACSKLIKSYSRWQRVPSTALEEDSQETEIVSHRGKPMNSQGKTDLRTTGSKLCAPLGERTIQVVTRAKGFSQRRRE